MNPPPLLRKFFFEPKKAVFSLLLIACLVGFSSDFRLYAYAGSETDDVDLNPLSEMSNLGLDNQYVTADGQAYLAGGPGSGPGQQALPITTTVFATTEIVYNQAGLQLALDNRVQHIIIANTIILASPLSITNASEYHVTIDSASGSLEIESGVAQRHFNIVSGAPLYLSFVNVVLEGNGQGGGISAGGTVTIGNPQIKDCFISASTEGGGIYANGVVRVEGGSISNCKALRGGGIMCSYAKSLTVVGVVISDNQANHTSAADSGLGGGIGVWQYGSLVAQNCTLSGNRATGDTASHKGLGGGIGVWMDSYSELENCTILGNMAGNFGGGVLSHWRSTLVIDGGNISGNDVTSSTAFGSGGGVCVAAGGNAQLKGDLTVSSNDAHYGAGLRLEYDVDATVESSVTFSLNDSTQTGGAISCGGNDSALAPSTLSIGAAQFGENTAQAGGAVYLGKKYTLNCTGAVFSHNAALNSGGVLYALQESTISFTDSALENNKAVYGGAVYMATAASSAVSTPLSLVRSRVYGNEVETVSVNGQGGGILIGNYCRASLTASQIENNKGGYGGGLAVFSNASLQTFTNTLIANNTSLKSGGGIYVAAASVVSLTGETSISGNKTDVSGGGIYLSAGSAIDATNATRITENQAAEFGGGIAGAQSKTITIRDQAEVSGNTAQKYGGGIYAHTGDVADRQTVITVADNATISYNSAGYGAGISGAYPDMEANVPTISLEGSARIVNNVAVNDGGGIWVPQESLAKVSALSGITFAGNVANRAYYMSSASPDAATHAIKILTTAYSAPPLGAPVFDYAYNNYDIAYRDGIFAVTVTFDAMGGVPATQTVSTKQGWSLGSAFVPAPTAAGSIFIGWYTEPYGEGMVFNKNTTVNADITVYAYWKKEITSQGDSIAQTNDAMAMPLLIGLICVILVAGGFIVWLIIRRRR